MDVAGRVAEFLESFAALERELGAVLVGQAEVVRLTLVALLCRGNVLLEGVPGLGKTLLVRSLGRVLGLSSKRIQFTPDLMPADLTGCTVLDESPGGGAPKLRFRPGPLFTNLVLADEINRATPKTQSALLEAMQEHQVTVGTESRRLDEPFFVVATQNPLEMEGTYPLPEAQLDRFFFKVLVRFPDEAVLADILGRTTVAGGSEPQQVIDGAKVLSAQDLVREVPAAPEVLRHAARIVRMTHPDTPGASDEVRRFVRCGASPRGAQALVLAGKARALLEGRHHVAAEDLVWAAAPALRHRLLRSFEGEAEGVEPDQLVAAAVRSAAAPGA